MKHYDALRSVPKDALKTIEFGNLKGKSDINPQWRYEAMTKEFGPCGVGWKFEVVSTWTQPANDGQVMVFVEVRAYIKEENEWSAPVPAIGGDFLMKKDKNGLHGNDEAYKMATTDALGTALKMFGVAADIYRGMNDTKYSRQPQQAAPAANKPNPTTFTNATVKTSQGSSTSAYKCAGCGEMITEPVAKFSTSKFKRPLCMKCQQKGATA